MNSIVPKPETTQRHDGEFSFEVLRIHPAAEAGVSIAQQFVQYLPERIRRPFPCELTESSAAANIQLVVADHMDVEAYQLNVLPEGVTIKASDPAGWFYGLQSLSQLLRNSTETNRLPCLRMEDSPRFSWRGIHLDVCRHFFDIEFIKRLLDLMAIHKLNVFHWHLTEDQGWRIDVPNRPLLAKISAWREEKGERYGGYYSDDQIREVVNYAADRFIKIVPEIELPGHSIAALAAYPELACQPKTFTVETEWGIFDDVYCAGNEQTFDFLQEVLDVTLDLFPGDVIHIGGDECPKTRWKTCPKCQARMASQGLANEDELQSWFVNRMVRYLGDRGRRAIGWDEILEGGLAPAALVMSWRGDVGGIEAAQMGHDVVMTPTSNCYFDYRQKDDDSEPGFHGVNTLQDVYQFEPIPRCLSVEQARHILGGQGNIWTERMFQPADVEFMIVPRLCALAEVLWSYDQRDWPDFCLRLKSHVQLLADLGYQGRPLDDID